MDILNTVSLESNRQIKINFDGGDLSSDAGLLLFKEFLGGIFMEEKDLTFIQEQIGYNFQNTDLLQQAFVRRSYAKEYGGEDNEILEFIGDKVLNLIVIKLLTEKYGCFISDYDDFDSSEEFDEFSCDKNEAELTELKKKLVQKKTLADRIAILDLADYLIMGNGDVQKILISKCPLKRICLRQLSVQWLWIPTGIWRMVFPF